MIYALSQCARRDWFESSPRTVPKPNCLEDGSGAEGDDEAESQFLNSQDTDLFDFKACDTEPFAAPL